MHNYIMAFGIILLALVSLTVSSNLSTQARSSQYLKEDIEIAVHDASLQVNNEQLAEGKIVFNKTKAKETFKNSFELNTGIDGSDYEIVDFKVFDHSNSTFPVNYESIKVNFQDTFIYPSILAIIKTSTDKYFYTSQEKSVIRVASYSYKMKNNNPITENPIVDSEPNENGYHWIVPFTNNITSHFMPYRLNPVTNVVEAHKGVDIASPEILNKPTVSIFDGEVTYAGRMGSYGNLVQITHDNGLVTRYAHLNQIQVSNGQNVTGGEVIGLIGSTGRSTGAHLHFETIYNGKHLNPLTFY